MSRKVAFIGREKELKDVQERINTLKQNSIIFLEADGGIGKTRMLQEIQLKYSDNQQQVIVSDIVDYDEYRYFTVGTMRNAIISKIGKEHFTKYHAFEKEHPSKKGHLNELFTKEFNDYEYSSKKKFVLLIDTAEKTQNAIFWDGFREMLQDLHNIVVIIAGRSKDHKGEPFSRKAVFFENKIEKYMLHDIVLKSFSEEEANDYFEKKRIQEKIANISESLRNCAVLLANGNPIILDLAIEWILQGYKEKPDQFFFDELQVDDCDVLAIYAPERLQQKYEKLVIYFEKNDNAITEMIHALLYIPRLKSDMLPYLFGDTISREDFEELKGYVFIKDAGQGYITLHDEMARLLNEYLRPKIDQGGIRKQEYAKKVLPFYEAEILHLEDLLKNPTDTIFKLKKRLYYNQVQRIYNLFIVGDVDRAMRGSTTLLQEAQKSGQYSLAQYLFRIIDIDDITNKLSLRQLAEFKTQQAKILSTIGKPQEAKILLLEFEKEHDPALSNFDRANLRNMLAGIYDKLGELSEAIAAQTFAYEIFTKSEQKIPSGRHLGTLYRQMGKHNFALKYLNEILTLTKNLSDDEKKSMYQAHICYQFANVYRVKGESVLALRYAKEALKIWSDQESSNNIAKAHIMIGNIYREKDRYVTAEKEYQKADDILEDDTNEVYLELLINRARSKSFQEKWKESNEDIQEADKRARKDNNPSALIKVLALLSSLYQEQGKMEKARKTLEEYEALSQKYGNVYFQAEVLVSFVELDYHEKVDDLKAKIFARAEELEAYRAEYDFPKLFGKMKLYQAKVLFDNGEYSEARDYYQEGFKELSRYEGYAIVDKELEKLLDTLTKWGIEEAMAYLRALEQSWESYPKLSQWCQREIVFLELGV